MQRDLTEALTRKTAGIFARHYPKADEASALGPLPRPTSILEEIMLYYDPVVFTRGG
jgi:hypothetical protein